MIKTRFVASVVSKAFTWAYTDLGLARSHASEIIGISPSALAQATPLGFEKNTPEYRKQLAFIRMYHLLKNALDGDAACMARWFNQFNIALEASPFDCCKTYEGIESVCDFLRAVKLSCDLGDSSYSLLGEKQASSSLVHSTSRVH